MDLNGHIKKVSQIVIPFFASKTNKSIFYIKNKKI